MIKHLNHFCYIQKLNCDVTITIFFNIILEILAIKIRLENQITDINIGKEKIEVDLVEKKVIRLNKRCR